MTWILIIWLGGGYNGDSPALSSVEFNSENSCRSAFVQIKKVNAGEVNLRGICTIKGDKE